MNHSSQHPGEPETVVLELFVAGGEAHSRRAETNLRAVCESHLRGSHRIEIVDVLERPDAALTRQIFLTPAVFKVSPPPQSVVYGSLDNRDKLLEGLGFTSEKS